MNGSIAILSSPFSTKLSPSLSQMDLTTLPLESMLFLCLGFLVLLVALLKLSGGEAKNLPPGRQGWPLVRENISFYCASRHSFFDFLQPRISRYGKIFTTHLFGKRTVISADANFNKWVLQNEGKLFRAKFPKAFSEVFGKYGMLSIHGDLQRKLHGVAINLLGQDKLKAHFLAEVDSMIRTRVRQWVGGEILLQDELRMMVLELMLKQLLDIDPSEEARAIAREFRDFTSSGIGCLPIRIPGTRFYRALKAREALVARVKKEIAEREEHTEVMRGDLLSRLLRQESRLPDEVIVDFILFLAHAGHHTSARVMVFAVKHLTDNPAALQQLREEHDAIAKDVDGGRLTWDHYKSMKFTQCVVNETLRLNGASLLVREAPNDVPADGYVIPKGTSIILALDGVHKDREKYDFPLVFNPWRWQSAGLPQDAAFAPFGGGPRLCPGSQLAQLEVSIFLHYLVTNCRWEKVKEDQAIQFPAPNFPLGFPIRLYPREM
ncbi:abietadienol/abietadienal oxidase-like isoform X2 [Nymphaea colorata]|uniref:abietadienol/abietadienal oxidase-like isoform X2 n=1 Tax=Nymphaea colorata TaxID=210225 RepID=UPI00214F4BCE|nr:abietadienol/abietadienal oxidase-like isoform X2 [Nymphaea colorata]